VLPFIGAADRDSQHHRHASFCCNAPSVLKPPPAGPSGCGPRTATGEGATSVATEDAPAWMCSGRPRGAGLVDYSGDSSTELGDERRCTLTACVVLTSNSLCCFITARPWLCASMLTLPEMHFAAQTEACSAGNKV